ncbi:MAG TPA: HAD family phosphatase [Spirochaetota bacterium]|nr:HAD family phosphatase [Spirochaetota bacterium]HNT11321.1 HAD family phosphatase [Spirochaetota bacterium]HOS38422.1 HAD family phosphatase [Spirochaetota bacterium]
MKHTRKAAPRPARVGAFFDLEKTIADHAVIWEFVMELYRRREMGLSVVVRTMWIYFKYSLGVVKNFETVMRDASRRAFQGRNAARYIEIFRELFDERLKHRIYPGARDTIAELKKRGVRTYIISTTFQSLVEFYANHLGIDEFYATSLEIVDGIHTGAINGPIYYYQHKASLMMEIAARDNIDLGRSFAFGDNLNDRVMLERVGHPHAVNPDKKLRAVAERGGWTILSWGI